MRIRQWTTVPADKIIFALALTCSAAWIAIIDEHSSSQVMAATQAKLVATIFSYEGQDFIRSQTTLVTQSGESAVGTKLDHDSPAYTALMQKRSYTGDVSLFGQKYDANYAPLIDKDGRLTGALFVAVAM